jgi:hypothetical protein
MGKKQPRGIPRLVRKEQLKWMKRPTPIWTEMPVERHRGKDE